MDVAARASRRSVVPRGLLGLLALVALVEWAVKRHELDLVGPMAWDWRLAGRRDASAEVLCFGDSLVKFGVQPRVLEARTGRRAASFALYSGPAPASYFLLRRALATGKRPAVVVVDFAAGILAEGPRSVRRPYPWAELLTAREAAELALSAGDADLFAAVVTAKLLPSVRSRHEIRACVRAICRGESASYRWIDVVLRRNWARNQGGEVNPRKRSPMGLPALLAQPPGPSAWWPDPVNARYAGRFLDLAEAWGIPVFWVLPPICPDLQRWQDRSGEEARYGRFVREAMAAHPSLTVIDARHAGYDSGVFADLVHLDRRGAVALTSAVAEVLGRPRDDAPAGTRWVELPAARAPAVGLDLEDVDQSRWALVDETKRRRQIAVHGAAVPVMARGSRGDARARR